jgi:hypothetical protein
MRSDALHTDATQIRGWEQFRMNNLGVENVAAAYYLGVSQRFTLGSESSASWQTEGALHRLRQE